MEILTLTRNQFMILSANEKMVVLIYNDNKGTSMNHGVLLNKDSGERVFESEINPVSESNKEFIQLMGEKNIQITASFTSNGYIVSEIDKQVERIRLLDLPGSIKAEAKIFINDDLIKCHTSSPSFHQLMLPMAKDAFLTISVQGEEIFVTPQFSLHSQCKPERGQIVDKSYHYDLNRYAMDAFDYSLFTIEHKDKEGDDSVISVSRGNLQDHTISNRNQRTRAKRAA